MLSHFPPVPCTARPPQLYAVFRFMSMFLLLCSRLSFFLCAQHNIAPRHRCLHCFCIICLVFFHFARLLTCSEPVSRVDELIDQAVEQKQGWCVCVVASPPTDALLMSTLPKSQKCRHLCHRSFALEPLSHVHDDGLSFHSHNTRSPFFLSWPNFHSDSVRKSSSGKCCLLFHLPSYKQKKPMPCYL